MSLNIDISNPKLYANKHFAKLLLDRNRVIISFGSRDSGKSYHIAQKIVYHILTEKYCKAVLLRKIYSDIKDSQYNTILSVISDWKLEEYFHCTKNPLEIKCLLNDNIIIARGLDKPTKLKSIKDPTIVWAEEADEISLRDYETTDMSIRSNIKDVLLQFIFTFNPEDESCWINKEFFPPSVSYEKDDGNFHFIESTQPKTTILHSTYKDNIYCNPQNRERYDNIKYLNLDRYRTACLGLWGGINEAIIFKEIYYKDVFPKEGERKFYGIGLDWGFSNHPTAPIECCISHGEIYLRELFYKTGLVNTTDIAEKKSIEKELKRCEVTDEEIFADCAEPKSVEELWDKGFNIVAPSKPKGSIEAGITNLKSYKLNVVNSPNLKKEFLNYSYKIDKEGTITNIPIDAWNHGIDGVRYWYKGKVSDPTEIGITVL